MSLKSVGSALTDTKILIPTLGVFDIICAAATITREANANGICIGVVMLLQGLLCCLLILKSRSVCEHKSLVLMAVLQMGNFVATLLSFSSYYTNNHPFTVHYLSALSALSAIGHISLTYFHQPLSYDRSQPKSMPISTLVILTLCALVWGISEGHLIGASYPTRIFNESVCGLITTILIISAFLAPRATRSTYYGLIGTIWTIASICLFGAALISYIQYATTRELHLIYGYGFLLYFTHLILIGCGIAVRGFTENVYLFKIRSDTHVDEQSTADKLRSFGTLDTEA